VFAPECLEVTVIDTGASALLFASEADDSGRQIGVVQMDTFVATMIVDPDGALERALAMYLPPDR
jgi:hypothetical protein